MAALEIWIAKNLGLLGVVVMIVLGSLVAHVKNYESSKREWSKNEHFWGIIRRMIYGSMAGIIVYQLHLEYHFSQPRAFIYTGIAAIFASDMFDFLWITSKAWVRKKLGLENDNGKDNAGKN